MYVCLCKGVTDHDIKRAVNEGATSFREVQQQLAVSTQCGKCARLARSIVQESLAQLEPGPSAPFYDATLALA